MNCVKNHMFRMGSLLLISVISLAALFWSRAPIGTPLSKAKSNPITTIDKGHRRPSQSPKNGAHDLSQEDIDILNGAPGAVKFDPGQTSVIRNQSLVGRYWLGRRRAPGRDKIGACIFK